MSYNSVLMKHSLTSWPVKYTLQNIEFVYSRFTSVQNHKCVITEKDRINFFTSFFYSLHYIFKGTMAHFIS